MVILHKEKTKKKTVGMRASSTKVAIHDTSHGLRMYATSSIANM